VVMVFPNIEKIKQDYTDKYVMVDPQRPELARFADVVGQVKTVNMSGRALVEFLDYHLNTGWYDIELEFLKVVDKPLPKPKEEKKSSPKAEAKPAAVKEASAPAASKPQAAGKPSTADILAKLKGGGGAAPAAKKEDAPKAAAPAAGKAADRAKMSVADMIAAAKGGAAPAAKDEPAALAQEAPAPGPSIPEPVAKAPAAEAASPAKSDGGIVKIDKSGMSIDQMIAYCREKDAG
jgi:pyruvate/2-oxoglutarate dehydrogenase complex dihydrolipoamide acyltransferase (E2) component